MQEEIEHKTVVLIENCAKLTERELRKAISKLLQRHNGNLKNFSEKQPQEPHGQMTVKELATQNKGMQSIEVTDKNIGSFNKVASKYGIDFSPYKVKGQNRYLVFFKSADADAMTAAFQEYTAKQVKRAKRPSVLKKLLHFKSQTKSATRKRQKERER